MPQIAAFTDDENLRMLVALDARMQASLALSRATLCALAVLSPLLNSTADAALEEEAGAQERGGAAASRQALDIIEDVRARLQQTPIEVQAALALERALLDAAGRCGSQKIDAS